MALRNAAWSFAQVLRQAPRALPENLERVAFDSVVTGSRNAATLAAVKTRIKSVQNIKKITSAMKMVAASKMRKAQSACEQARGLPVMFLKLFGDLPDMPVRKTVNMPISTDKGMCGGINSQIGKLTNLCIAVDNQDAEKKNTLLTVGSKGGGIMRRVHPQKIEAMVADYSKNTITFALASSVAEEVLKTEYDSVRLLYNTFKSAMSFKPTIATILSPETLDKSDAIAATFDTYEIEGPDRPEMLQDLAEFQLGSMLYYAMNEACTSEHASRMSAMESSTKNSSEMLSKLTLTFNRTRQAKITTELNEIISGAIAAEG